MKVQWSGVGVTDGRGSIGTDVYSRNRGGAYSRNRTTPVDTPSFNRAFVRATISMLSVYWQGLDEFERDLWNRNCYSIKKTNVLSNEYALSGFNWFCQVNFIRVIGSFTIQLTPPEDIHPLPISRITLVDAAIGNINMNILFADGTFTSGSDDYVIIASAPAVSPGINFKRTGYKWIVGIPPGEDCSHAQLWDIYTGDFGIPPIGSKIFFQIYGVNYTSGRKTPKVYVSGVVS